MVKLEGWALGTDTRQRGEVVGRGRAGCCPLEGVSVTPRIVNGNDLAVAERLEHVPNERQEADTEDEGEDRGELVQTGESVGREVVSVTTWHTFVTQPVLDQERSVESDDC